MSVLCNKLIIPRMLSRQFFLVLDTGKLLPTTWGDYLLIRAMAAVGHNIRCNVGRDITVRVVMIFVRIGLRISMQAVMELLGDLAVILK